MINFQKGFKVVIGAVLAVSLTACGGGGGQGGAADNTVVVGGKNFTEQDILVHMMSTLIEQKTDLEVVRKPFLGGSQLVHQAMLQGDVDMYPEYTGTALTATLEMDPMTDPQETYETVKAAYEEQFNLTWLEPFGFNNTYALSMREDHAKELGIETYSQLAEQSPNLVLGATQEFLERPDGYKGLQEVYGMKFKDAKGFDPGLTYSAVKEGQVDVNDAFSTDGRIVAFNLKVLEDDKNFFPPYYVTPVIRMDTLEAHPELADVLNQLGGILDEKKMSELNASVDLEGKKAQDVAEDFLREKGLIE
jgi:glycine betaine/choline ABC-type transport system substrate-binding protein